MRKIQRETDTRIELPQENSDSDIILIIGKKENVQKAHARLLAIEKDMVSFYYEAFSFSFVRDSMVYATLLKLNWV